MKFPCTACGSCCTDLHENWVGHDDFKARGWILPSGACVNYDRATRRCGIYETRPDACRVDREQHIVGFPGAQETWFAYVESCCDDAHLREYGVPRERGVECSHRVPGRIASRKILGRCERHQDYRSTGCKDCLCP